MPVCQNPLNWPAHQPRTEDPKRSRFKDVAVPGLLDQLERELYLLKCHSVIVTADLNTGRSVRFLAGWSKDDDPGVAVYWTTRAGVRQCLAIDMWATPGENLRAIVLSIEAIRGLARWGGNSMTDSALSGVAALTGRRWFEGCEDKESADKRYRQLAKEHHPDHGGDAVTMASINEEYEGLSYA